MSAPANELAARLLENEENIDPRAFILGTRPEDIARREALARRKQNAEATLREYDKKFTAQRALGDVTPDTDAHYFWHRELTYSDKVTPLEVRRNGETQRWVTRPDEFRIPAKYGLYDFFNITHHNAHEWTTIRPPLKAKPTKIKP